MLLQGWAAAAVRHADPVWAEALLGALPALRLDDTLSSLDRAAAGGALEALVLESLRARTRGRYA